MMEQRKWLQCVEISSFVDNKDRKNEYISNEFLHEVSIQRKEENEFVS